jgi:hypothetical protein
MKFVWNEIPPKVMALEGTLDEWISPLQNPIVFAPEFNKSLFYPNYDEYLLTMHLHGLVYIL